VVEVPLDRRHQVRDEIVAALELDVDLRPRALHLVPEADEPIVEPHHESDDHDRDRMIAGPREKAEARSQFIACSRLPEATSTCQLYTEDASGDRVNIVNRSQTVNAFLPL